MRKQEYLHLHALLVTTSHYLIEHEGMPATRIAGYHRLDVRPASVQKSKRSITRR